MDTHILQKVQLKTEELLKNLGLEAKVLVEVDQSEVVRVDILPQNQDDSLGRLIGFRGETLRSLQLILSLIVNQGEEERIRIVVDIDGYRKQHEEKLKILARQTAEKVRSLCEPVSLTPMSPYERRLIHLEVAEIEGVASESVDEGRERRVVIKPSS